MKLLIAEDDSDSSAMLRALIQEMGFDVIVASDGIAAFELLSMPDSPRLALLDLNMPDMDGLEVCRKLRKTTNSVAHYIIILTGQSGKEDVVAGLSAGANDYISKPFHVEELIARIKVGQRMVELQQTLSDRIKELRKALAQVKTLQGLLPICSYCHKIRTDQEVWERIENYIIQRSDVKFSHGICPACLEKVLADVKKKFFSKVK
jgi:DNA-binding response OmpR family regulator